MLCWRLCSPPLCLQRFVLAAVVRGYLAAAVCCLHKLVCRWWLRSRHLLACEQWGCRTALVVLVHCLALGGVEGFR